MIALLHSRSCLLVVALAITTACSVNRHATGQPGTVDLTQPNARTALAGTSWQLIEIASMDDHVYAPDDRSLYTLVFNADGSMQVRTDCNSGTGSWVS